MRGGERPTERAAAVRALRPGYSVRARADAGFRCVLEVPRRRGAGEAARAGPAAGTERGENVTACRACDVETVGFSLCGPCQADWHGSPEWERFRGQGADVDDARWVTAKADYVRRVRDERLNGVRT